MTMPHADSRIREHDVQHRRLGDAHDPRHLDASAGAAGVSGSR